MRERGYAQAAGEREPGLTAIAAPIRSARGELEAIVALQGPSARFDGRRSRRGAPASRRARGRDLARARLERRLTMQFDTKIAVVLRDDLAVWQKTNVTAFLVSGIAGTVPDVVGEPYRDASGNEYLPMFVQPVLVYQADDGALRRAYTRARDRDVTLAVYTADLFETGHDEANRAAVAAVPEDELDLVGIAFRAERKVVDKVVDGLRFHP